MMDEAIRLAEAEEWQQAAAAFQHLILQEPENASAQEMLAQVLMEAGEQEGALEAARKAVQLQPQWAEASVTLARVLRNIGELADALATYQRAQELLRDSSPEVCDELASEASEAAELYSQQVARRVGRPFSIKTAPGTGVGPGCVVWESGLMLARLMVEVWGDQPGCLQGVRAIELGSGTGVAGITAAALGAQVLLTDTPAVTPLLQANVSASLNAVSSAGGQASCAPLVWHDLPHQLPQSTAGGGATPTTSTPGDGDHTRPGTGAGGGATTGQGGAGCAGGVVRQFLEGGCTCILGADLVHSPQQVPQLRHALTWLLAQLTDPHTQLPDSAPHPLTGEPVAPPPLQLPQAPPPPPRTTTTPQAPPPPPPRTQAPDATSDRVVAIDAPPATAVPNSVHVHDPTCNDAQCTAHQGALGHDPTCNDVHCTALQGTPGHDDSTCDVHCTPHQAGRDSTCDVHCTAHQAGHDAQHTPSTPVRLQQVLNSGQLVFLLAHKHRSQVVDDALWCMLQECGFAFLDAGTSAAAKADWQSQCLAESGHCRTYCLVSQARLISQG